MVLSMPSEVARWLWLPVLDDCHAGVSDFRGEGPTHDERDIGVSCRDDAAAGKVPTGELGVGSVSGRDGEEYRPADDTEHERNHYRNTTGLLPVGIGGEEQHEHKGNSVRRDSHELCASICEA